ncbi:MAG: YdcF family protein [Alphaproteobacteria bacterium]|nr:YdcF family protein [Alphaproteobacteria bacterium]
MIRCLRFAIWFVFALIVFWLAGYGLFVSRVLAETPDQPDRQTDVIVVLTGGNFRVDTGFDLFAQKRAPHLFITGVHDTVSLDDLIHQWKSEETETPRLPACCMDLGHKALTTVENATETEEWIKAQKDDIHSLRLVTSPYHMPRALLEFKSLMPEIEIIPHAVMRDQRSMEDRFFWNITFLEYHKWLVRQVQLALPFIPWPAMK